jgi:hypothetical protein
MSTEAITETTLSRTPAPRRRLWIYALIVVLVVISFGYLSLINSRDNFANSDFYRVLYEATNKFNENLNQLDKMHVNEESINSIRTQLPSYQRQQTAQSENTNKNFSYFLSGQKILIKNVNFDAEVKITDILPKPKHGFSQYLFANIEGKVLATTGDEKTISIENLSSINSEIRKHKRGYQFFLKESENSAEEFDKQHLPSYSSHVDMNLSYGEFRIFIFPFSLDTALNTKLNSQKQAHSDSVSPDNPINTLYLVGLLPKHKLHTEGTGHWNLSLLLATLVSLLFIWTLLRLFLLPKNQSITPLYRGFTMLSSYFFFIVLIALVLAFMQKTALQMNKDKEAAAYAKKLYEQLNGELYQVFKDLAYYRPFYHSLLAEQNNFQAVNDSNSARSDKNTPATNSVPQMIETSLTAITPSSCEPIPEGKLPGYAFTPFKAYPIKFNCLTNINGKEAWKVDLELDQSAELVLLQAQQKNVKDEPLLSFMASNLDLKVKPNGTVESYISQGEQISLPANNILTVFAINDEGNTVLPMIYYQESNAPPQVLNLIHRDYYKKVRDAQGWQLCFTAEKKNNHQCVEYKNVYIQRLLNISDGTRGTTISMPMYDVSKYPDIPAERLAYTLGADVILPSLSLATPAPYDFTYMVIDRNNGDVLFHSDESRTLVENLFYSYNSKSNLSQWMKAGLDHYPELSEDIIEGHYHGHPGRFVLTPAPVDAWAIVIFYPNNSLDALMANQILFISVSLALALLTVVILFIVFRRFFYTNQKIKKLSHPINVKGRVIFMISSLILCAVYSLSYIDLLIDFAKIWPQSEDLFFLILLSAIILLLIIIYRICNNHLVFIDSSSNKSITICLITLFVLSMLSIAHFYYLRTAAQMPLKALDFHYQQIHCNWLNYERQEITKMALSRFPNSITQQRIEPIKLLPIETELKNKLTDEKICEKHSSAIEPDDYLSLNSLVGITYLWQWINTYLLIDNLPPTSSFAIPQDFKCRLVASSEHWYLHIGHYHLGLVRI